MPRHTKYQHGGDEGLKASLLCVSRMSLHRYRCWLNGLRDRKKSRQPDDEMCRDITILDDAFTALREVAARRARKAREAK